jgi:REP element-mobilizing transposase RayT
MARHPRLSGEELYHHIYAWGNNRQAIFISDQHYARYLDFLETYSKDYRVDIIAYALMRSHIHLFVFDFPGKVSEFMNSLHGKYAQYFNRLTGRVGHVFGERFNNKIVQANKYGLWLSRYIHRQAVEAGLVTDPRCYPWTSYHIYLEEAPMSFVKSGIILEQFGNEQERISRYEEFVKSTEDEPIDWDVKSATIVGDDFFQQEVLKEDTAKHRENLSDNKIPELINARFKVSPEFLFSAHGLHEKRLRHKIIRYLINDVGLKPIKVARLCHISRSAVRRSLNTKV